VTRQIDALAATPVALMPRSDWRTERIVERTLHLAIEVCMDVADHIVADRRLRIPETGAESFGILAEAGLLPAPLAAALALMVWPRARQWGPCCAGWPWAVSEPDAAAAVQ
jgi:uncharacterized protein YutE (UPF0331/DUF86 family)